MSSAALIMSKLHEYFVLILLLLVDFTPFAGDLQGDGLQLEYEMKLTNGQSFWTQHFSADEFGKSSERERERLWNELLMAQANAT